MKLQTIVQALEKIAPPALAEEWDNTGLLLNPLEPHDPDRVLLTIDLSEAVAAEAVEAGVGLVVAYHPVLFRPVQRLDADRAHDRAVMRLLRADIALYSPHTALDAVRGGVNDWLAEGVGEGTVSVLQPLENADGAGQGRMVELAEPVELDALARRIGGYLGLPSVRIARSANLGPVRTVALCAGAGADVFQGVEADCFLTGEMGHHHILAAVQSGTHVILCEHTNTERGYLPILGKKLREALGPEIEIRLSARDRDPLEPPFAILD